MQNDPDYEEYMVNWRYRVDHGLLTENVQSNGMIVHHFCDVGEQTATKILYGTETRTVYGCQEYM
jgi:hypothetical protein